METVSLIMLAVGKILRSSFTSDMEVMSSEAKAIFSNEEDRLKYIDAVKLLNKNPEEKQTITLSNKETITLVS